MITTKKLVVALRKVPEKKFRIYDLAPHLLDANGKVDVEKCIGNHADINMAIMEVDRYVHSVHDLVRSLPNIRSGDAQQTGEDEEDDDIDFDEDDVE